MANNMYNMAVYNNITPAQVKDLTNNGVTNTNIPFASPQEMMNFILYTVISQGAPSSYFDNWEIMIVSVDTTTNGEFAMNTHSIDPTGQREYVPFKQIKNLVQQFWSLNSNNVTGIELKLRLPKSNVSGSSSMITQNNIDPTGAYSDFNVSFYYGGGIVIAVPTAVEAIQNAPAKPVQTWYETVNNMILTWRQNNLKQS